MPKERQLCGTIGFWENWNKHDTYTEEQIEGWLEVIDSNSDWLGPTEVQTMKEMFKKKKPKSANFLRHYLATRLDVESGRLSLAALHDVTGFDPTNYLGLANPTAAALVKIVAAIESKFGTTPTKDEFEITKDIADAVNNCYDEPSFPDLCDEFGKPSALTMLYTGDGPDATAHTQNADKVSVIGDPMDEPVVRIVASENEDGSGKIYFDGEVALGESFQIDAANAGDSKLRSKTFVLIYDLDGVLLQTVEFHTSCSQPLLLGDQFGGVRLDDFVGEGGTGTEEPVTDNLCDQFSNPQVLGMIYTGDGPDATSHSQDPGKVSVNGDPEDESVVRIVASDNQDGTGKIYFDGEVVLGAGFQIDAGNAGDDKLRSKTFILVYDLDGVVLQTVEFHTSCSQPLVLDDQFGSVQLTSFLDKDGDGP